MGEMIGLPIPEIINPMMHPEAFATVELVLTLPVLFLGR